MKSYTIVGYTYEAETFTPEDLVEYMVARRDLAPAARDMAVEDVLDQLANEMGIERYDERTFDSEEFPKVIFADQVETREEMKYLLGYTDEDLDKLDWDEEL